MSYQEFNRGLTAEQLMRIRQREADERARERFEEEDDLASIVRPLLAEEMTEDDYGQRRRHRVVRK
jgi:hypothetical protein